MTDTPTHTTVLQFSGFFPGNLGEPTPEETFIQSHEYEVEGARPRARPKKIWREIVEKDCQARKLNWEDVMDHIRWMKQIRED